MSYILEALKKLEREPGKDTRSAGPSGRSLPGKKEKAFLALYNRRTCFS